MLTEVSKFTLNTTWNRTSQESSGNMIPRSEKPQSNPSQKVSNPISPLNAVPYRFFSPFGAFTYFPAIEYMSEDLKVSLQLMNLTVTAFFGLSIWFILVIYAGSCIGLALQESHPLLLIFRMLQSAGSSAHGFSPDSRSGTIALGSIVVADLAPPHDRSHYIGAMQTGSKSWTRSRGRSRRESRLAPDLLGPSYIGVFFLITSILFFRETYRNIVGTGRTPAAGMNEPLMAIGVPNMDSRVVSEGSLPEGRRWQRVSKVFQMSSNQILQISMTLIVDIHPTQAGLASVSVNLTRCTAAAVGVVALPSSRSTWNWVDVHNT
ncbi:hypothetical protein GCG54_00015264 [Colletotrichum gloeosporioides]|uniref:Major facilitator superfamily transporter n=1 Tax=Colletotrichum gloeosporioides TaxID=474922 RepID=A0A8H4C6E7_COLGL|nr:uncharacterized protein GCG54_00015264 [Colletotrichum gloeosporioides]KAF3798285.1 hypothetical protein GCG54_00015264 [Colletotrichum gloeosporioides]